MATRRHLPMLPSTPAPAPVGTPVDGTAEDPPPWHWIPLGTALSVLVFALFAPQAASLGRRVLGHFYGRSTRAAQMAALRAMRPRVAMLHELAASAVSLTALGLAIFLGGYVIGRYGARTNARHGTLSGACTAVLFWALTGWLPAVLVAIPFGMLAGHVGARAGVHIRDRAN